MNWGNEAMFVPIAK